ncbi:MAG TPA: serine hydrolase domain-containing protein [Acidimicrobiia bacterium]|nr:serine hydrolase domain-containing protein [Acidimicrobiia bacterium]
MPKWTQRLALGLASLLAVAGGSFLNQAGSTAGASTKSLHPDGGGVPTVQTDAGQFKNCTEPPGDALWEQAKADEVGLDAGRLQAAADYYRDQLQATMRVYRFNCLVKTGAYDPVMERFLSHMFSTTKPTMTLVAGAAVRKGLLNVNDTVGKYFPDRGDAAHRAITVRQLLQHTSGIEMHWATDLDENLPDTVDAFMSLKIVHPPGTWFQYTQIGCNMMSAVIEKAVGEKFQTFAQREVFDKIGILDGNYYWSKDRAGWSYGYSGLYLRPIDMVRVGTLMLQKGVYRGQRVVDESFIKEMATGTEPNPGFGYNMWINSAPHFVSAAINQRQVIDAPIIASAPHDMFFSWGWRGRHIYVIPSLDMVVTVTPFGGQAPCPGAVCTFMNGYPGQGPGSGPGAQMDGNQISQAEVSKGHHEFFRLLMSAVTDQKIADPGPWDTPDDNNFDPSLFVGDPDRQMQEAGMGQKMDNYPPYFADYAKVPGVYLKNMTTK